MGDPMTPEDLDKWAAELMGLKVNPYNAEMLLFPDESFILTDEWHPTTDMNQTFMVVAKMRERGYMLYLIGPIWEARFIKIGDHTEDSIIVNDNNPATATIKAAYAAVTSKGEK
jgi:hypothetical protein